MVWDTVPCSTCILRALPLKITVIIGAKKDATISAGCLPEAELNPL
jgi:hypothetical protein